MKRVGSWSYSYYRSSKHSYLSPTCLLKCTTHSGSALGSHWIYPRNPGHDSGIHPGWDGDPLQGTVYIHTHSYLAVIYLSQSKVTLLCYWELEVPREPGRTSTGLTQWSWRCDAATRPPVPASHVPQSRQRVNASVSKMSENINLQLSFLFTELTLETPSGKVKVMFFT